ncbi:MAG: hypothetical protein HXY41_00965 [Chloroflexi bacterium]|nr:hypothetical protein [Chloroflexota bacterium]
MLTMHDLLREADKLPTAEKWHLVRHLLRSLEYEQTGPGSSDWHEFIEQTAGILADDPIERPPQPPFEEREPLE